MEEQGITDHPILTCPDCGATGTGTFCAQCGEEMEPYLPKVRHYLQELLGEFLSFDSKVIRTVPALLFRPGFLTKEYLAGRRKKYLLPSRLYFLIAVVCFFALGATLRDHVKPDAVTNSKSWFKVYGGSHSADSTKTVETSTDPVAVKNGKIWFGYFTEVTPYVILIGSTPLFALILKLIYRKKKLLYVQHLIFSFHFFAFALIVLIGGAALNSADLLLIGLLLFLIYLYFALRIVYWDRGFRLVYHFIVSTIFYFFLTGVGALASALIAYLVAAYLGAIPKGSDIYF